MSESASPQTPSPPAPVPAVSVSAPRTRDDSSQLFKLIISVMVLLIYIVAFGVALWIKSETFLGVLVGGAAGMANTAVTYWMGSSDSSSRKDATIAMATKSLAES